MKHKQSVFVVVCKEERTGREFMDLESSHIGNVERTIAYGQGASMGTWSLTDIQMAADRLRSFRGEGLEDAVLYHRYREDHDLPHSGDAQFLVTALADEKSMYANEE